MYFYKKWLKRANYQAELLTHFKTDIDFDPEDPISLLYKLLEETTKLRLEVFHLTGDRHEDITVLLNLTRLFFENNPDYLLNRAKIDQAGS